MIHINFLIVINITKIENNIWVYISKSLIPEPRYICIKECKGIF